MLDCVFSDQTSTRGPVDSAAISEALRKAYDADAPADELEEEKK